jgi:hypothetical protein
MGKSDDDSVEQLILYLNHCVRKTSVVTMSSQASFPTLSVYTLMLVPVKRKMHKM